MDLFTEKLVYSVVYYGARAFMHTFGRLDVYGLENIPKCGCLIASNHVSFIDPPLIGSCIPKEMFFLARKTLNDNPILGRVLPHCNVIPVDRDGGSDVAAFKKMFKVLRDGHSILLFPEGTRSKDGKFGKAQGGAGLIACKARVPVVPVRLFGTNEVLQRGTFLPKRAELKVCFGKPMYPEEFDPGKDCPDRFREASRRFMARIAEMEEPKLSKY